MTATQTSAHPDLCVCQWCSGESEGVPQWCAHPRETYANSAHGVAECLRYGCEAWRSWPHDEVDEIPGVRVDVDYWTPSTPARGLIEFASERGEGVYFDTEQEAVVEAAEIGERA